MLTEFLVGTGDRTQRRESLTNRRKLIAHKPAVGQVNVRR